MRGSFRYLILFILSLLYSIKGEAAKHALIIGISEYPKTEITDASWPLIHGANDIALIAPTLRKQGFTVKELTNEMATASAIRASLCGLSKKTQKGDIVYLHFSGHGQPFEDTSGDEEDGWDEAIVPYDAQARYHKKYKGHNHILDDELEKSINLIREKVGSSGYVYVILDACHMGGASREESEIEREDYVRGTDSGFSPNSKKYIPRIDRRGHFQVKKSAKLSGICYIEACRSYQTNAEIKENGQFYGPLTFYINQTLSKVDLSTNSSWTSSVVKAMSRDKRLIKQNPVIETDQ